MSDPSLATLLPTAPASATQAAGRGASAGESEPPGTCFHCGTPNPSVPAWRLVVDGRERTFCCAGCLAVAQTIRAAGLERFYVQRSALADRLPAAADEWTHFDAAADAAGLVAQVGPDVREVSLLLEGVRCAACVRLIEGYLERQPGVIEAGVNFATRRASVRWDSRRARLSALLRAVAAIGYRAFPYDPARREALARREDRALLLRMAVALLAMMQVMMFSVPVYVTADGVEPQYRVLLEWASLVLTLPVVLYCAAPFFAGAARDLRHRRLGMDVPVALGIAGAFAASVAATLTRSGAVYYDSVTMFVALLLVARYCELRARQKAGDAVEAIAPELPATATRLPRYPDAAATETVPAARLSCGEFVRIDAGAAIPVDGDIVDGRSNVEEAVLTGESWPRAKGPGDAVLAGSLNRESPLIVRVREAGEATVLAGLVRLVERAAAARPRIARLADRAAAWFVGALLLIAAGTAMAWLQHDPGRALAVTLAVLVVSCPCALSLATPAALAAGAGALGRERILAVRASALETLARVSHVVFDKTGTLTLGQVRLVGVTPLAGFDRKSCLALAAALEAGSKHPIAAVFAASSPPAAAVSGVGASAGCGVEGRVDGKSVRLGRPDWVAELHGKSVPDAMPAHAADRTPVALGDSSGWLAWFELADERRPGAAELVAALERMGIAVSLLSGDGDRSARALGAAVGIAAARGDARPEDKRAFVAARQREGAVVAMVGDGINDAPSLAQADVSLCFGNAATLTQWTADVVVLGEDPRRIADAIRHARRTFRVVRENLLWAAAYNLIAIPLAATGYLTPLAAALGMSASSLLVVGNALRLLRVR